MVSGQAQPSPDSLVNPVIGYDHSSDKCICSCYLINAQSVANKRVDLHDSLQFSKPDIVGITETWLRQEDVFNLPASLSASYNVFRRDRSSGVGGGVMLLVKACLRPILVDSFIVNKCEVLIVRLLNDHHFILVYRPPNTTLDDSTCLFQRLESYISEVARVVLFGDFNLPDIDWANLTCTRPSSRCFLDMCDDIPLRQNVSTPTRGSNTLDLVLTLPDAHVHNIKTFPPLKNSDHRIVNFQYIASKSSNNITKSKKLFEKADYEIICAFLILIDWVREFSTLNTVEEYWGFLKGILNQAIEEFVPEREIQNRDFYDPKSARLNNLRIKLYDKYCRFPTVVNYYNYDRVNKCLIDHVAERQKKYAYELFFQKGYKPKVFFNYMNNNLKTNNDFTSVLKSDNSIATEHIDIGNEFRSIFMSKFVEDDGRLPRVTPPMISALKQVPKCTPKMVISIMKRLNLNSSAGPCGIPPKFLYRCISNLALPISLLINKSIETGTIPADWKVSFVTPRHKAGPKNDPENFRPIAIASVFSKIIEMFIVDHMLDHLRSNDLIGSHQHGFLKGRSVQTNLLCSLRDWIKNYEEGVGTDVIHIDYKRAFDSVSHKKLLHKLSSEFGFDSRIVGWVEDFLRDRSARVKICGVLSDPYDVVSGVPQGSIIGPLLFLLYVNEMETLSGSSTLSSYADDTKIYKPIRDSSDSASLQESVNNISDWSGMWQLPINYRKCLSIHLGPNNNDFAYDIDGNTLSKVSHVRDLGIIFQSNFKIDLHISHIAQTANFVIRNIRLCFRNFDPRFYCFLYITYVRPLLESSSSVFSPHLLKDISKIERVQRNFTRFLPGLGELGYSERLSWLGIERLECRRIRADLLRHRYYVRRYGSPFFGFFFTFSEGSRRGHALKLVKPFCRTTVALNFWSN